MDEKTLRESLKAIGDACRAAGFDPAMQACGEILRSNRDMGLHADSLTPIALRMRDGEWEYPCVCSIEVRPMQRNYSVRKSGRN